LVSVAVRPVWLPRYTLPFLPALFALTALGLTRIGAFAPKLAVALAAGLLLAEGATRVGTAILVPAEDWRKAAAYVLDRAGDETVAVVGASPLDASASSIGVWTYYYPGPTAYLGQVPDGDIPARWLVMRSNACGIYGDERKRLGARLVGRGARWTELPGIDVFEMPSPSTRGRSQILRR
jgi:hypothetical protein